MNFPQAKGNAKVLVFINRRGRLCDFEITDEFLISALRHMGIPLYLYDISRGSLSRNEVINSSLIVLGQENITRDLPDKVWEAIAFAIRNGTGLINFDCNLREVQKSRLSLLGLTLEKAPAYSNLLEISNNTHYITRYKQDERLVNLKRFIPAYRVRDMDSNSEVLINMVLGKEQLIYTRHLIPKVSFEPSHIPAVVVRELGEGAGRVVQFLISPRIWLQEFLGHCAGMDDIFYNSIVWAAKKPFAIKRIPPFVTIKIDDCKGVHNFRYIDVLNKFDHIPMASCFWDDLSEKGWKELKRLHKAKKAEFSTHAFSYYETLYYDFGIGEYSQEKLKELFEKEDEIIRKHGIALPKTIHTHWGEIGTNVLPFLRKRGRLFMGYPFRLGELKVERRALGAYPCGLNAYLYDYLSEDEDFFMLAAQTKIKESGSVDFLEEGVLRWLGQAGENSINKAIQRGSFQLKRGLENLFWGEIVTHEQKFSVLQLKEIEEIFKGIKSETKTYPKIFKPFDYVAQYVKSHRESWLSKVTVSKKGSIEYEIGGKPKTKQFVTIYRKDLKEELQISQ